MTVAGKAKMKRGLESQIVSEARKLAETTRFWTELHNALFGVGGLVSQKFKTETERRAFASTDEFQTIMGLIEGKRTFDGDPESIATLAESVNGAVSIRMPKSIHAALLAEAKSEGVSLNQLCVAKLCIQLRELAR